jgi:hypothetical protein
VPERLWDTEICISCDGRHSKGAGPTIRQRVLISTMWAMQRNTLPSSRSAGLYLNLGKGECAELGQRSHTVPIGEDRRKSLPGGQTLSNVPVETGEHMGTLG